MATRRILAFDPYLLVFVIGVMIAASYAARPVPRLEDGAASTPTVARVGQWARVAGVPFALGLALMVIGGLLSRARRRRRLARLPNGAQHAADVESTTQAARAVVSRARETLRRASELDPGRDADTLAELLDQVLERDVAELLELKSALMAELGLVRYAAFIGHFSAAERNAARAWSALTDGVPSEAPACLERARAAVARALGELSDGQGDGREAD